MYRFCIFYIWSIPQASCGQNAVGSYITNLTKPGQVPILLSLFTSKIQNFNMFDACHYISYCLHVKCGTRYCASMCCRNRSGFRSKTQSCFFLGFFLLLLICDETICEPSVCHYYCEIQKKINIDLQILKR